MTSSNNSISNISSINNNGHGVYFEKSPRNSIFNSKIMSNNGSGFHIVHNSSFIILENNDIYDGRNGIYTERSTNILLNRSFINSSQKEAVLKIAELCDELGVNKLVVGYVEGKIKSYFDNFVRNFKKEKPKIEVVMVDETLTTRQAQETMIKLQLSKKKRQKKEHEMAAVLILQSYLNQRD